jgi:hypothetical protein
LKQPTGSNETIEQVLSWRRFFQEVRLLWAAWLSSLDAEFQEHWSSGSAFGPEAWIDPVVRISSDAQVFCDTLRDALASAD